MSQVREFCYPGRIPFSRDFYSGQIRDGGTKKINHLKEGEASALLLHFHGTFFSDHARASRRIDSSQLESTRATWNAGYWFNAIFHQTFRWKMASTFRHVSHGGVISIKIFSKSNLILRHMSLLHISYTVYIFDKIQKGTVSLKKD